MDWEYALGLAAAAVLGTAAGAMFRLRAYAAPRADGAMARADGGMARVGGGMARVGGGMARVGGAAPRIGRVAARPTAVTGGVTAVAPPVDPPGRTRAILAALRFGVIVLDPDDRPVLANAAAADLGLVRPGPDGGSEAHAIVRTLAGQARHAGRRREVEVDMPRGDVGPLGVHARAVLLDDGSVVVEAHDVTEAHRVARVRRDFVANVSHELKTPVGALQLLAEALLDATDPSAEGASDGAGPDPEAARRFAERIRHESSRLGKLVGELLELSRLQGAEPLPALEPVAVDRILAEVVDRARTPAAAKGIEMLLPGDRGLTVFGSENQLVTAVANLVENAIAYSPEGTQIMIDVQAERDAVAISVTDHGIGIEPRDLDRIFERFYRADRARSRSTGGTGLGLAIVKHIATNHAGRVDVTSVAGQGSTFTLRLPARLPADELPLPTSVEIDAQSADLHGGAL